MLAVLSDLSHGTESEEGAGGTNAAESGGVVSAAPSGWADAL
jgi:hypothetical protein